ncbi:hypothetical protein LAZ67_X000622 [Cordylochernes scorpioides]|uniref:Uncharacterized protein n=1 Tax=Cordylochernes scorpioides TaxID=51811 RepID=A0ABY6LUD2_9ARAC|nr:hypothetical protein LAZ67_X000622 [Cordylochernes scorpioides]
MKGRRFEDVEDIQSSVTSTLRAITQELLQKSFDSLLDRATQRINEKILNEMLRAEWSEFKTTNKENFSENKKPVESHLRER